MASLLLHVEDPGAVNLIAPLAGPLRAAGHDVTLLADSTVTGYLRDRDLGFDGLGDDPAEAMGADLPDLLLVGTSENPRGSSLAMIDRARTCHVTSLGAVDMIANAANRFRGLSDDPLCHAPDWLAVPDTATAQAYGELGFPSDRIVACGHPHYDVVRARRAEMEETPLAARRERHALGITEGRLLVVFLAEAVDQLDPAASRIEDDCAFAGSGASDDRTTVILEAVLDALDETGLNPYVVLRLHPKNGRDDYAALHGRIDHVSQGGDPLDLVGCADLVIGMTTFLLVEAALLGRPTLSVLPRAQEAAWLPTTAGGVTPVAASKESLIEQLSSCFGMSTPLPDDAAGVLPAGSGFNYVTLISRILASSTRHAHEQ